MSTNTDGSLNSATDGPKPARRLRRTSVRALIALVACCAAILWTWRRVSENSDPVLAEARSILKRAIGALESAKPAERVIAIQELSRLNVGDTSNAILPLSRALGDPVPEVRVEAAEALYLIGPSAVKSGSAGETLPAALTALIPCLKDPDPAVRSAAFKALGSIGSSAVASGSADEAIRAAATALFGCLNDPDPGIRSAAAATLGNIASTKLAVTATAPIDRKAVVDALVELLGDRDALVRRAAISRIGPSDPEQGGDPQKALAVGLKDASADNRVVAMNGLIFIRKGLDPWVPVMLRLAENDPDPKVRERCIATMRYAFRPPAVTAAVIPDLTASLRSANAKVRSQAAALLGEFKSEARPAIPELLRVLNEPFDPHVEAVRGPAHNLDPASEAAIALGRIAPGSANEKDVIAALMKVAESGPMSRQGWAAVALGEFGPAAVETVSVLIKVMKDTTPDDQFEREASSASALGKIAPDTPAADQAIAALLSALESTVWSSRYQAIEALARFGPKAATAVPRIRELKTDHDASVRDAAPKALRAIEKVSAQ